jgi:hypothetical protein
VEARARQTEPEEKLSALFGGFLLSLAREVFGLALHWAVFYFLFFSSLTVLGSFPLSQFPFSTFVLVFCFQLFPEITSADHVTRAKLGRGSLYRRQSGLSHHK